MKITKLETIMIKPRTMFLKMHTDEGLIGYGEPIMEGQAHSVAAVIKQFGNKYLIGKDPREISRHWQAMYRGWFFRGGPVISSAISGIEHAMWDIFGKSLGLPVYKLLGGSCRKNIRVYSNLFTCEYDVDNKKPEDYADNALEKIRQGFTAIKFAIPYSKNILDNMDHIDYCSSIMGSIREAVGKSVDVAIDFHGRINPNMAKILIKELEEYNPFFIEEPCLPENVDAMVEISRSTTVPIATGERLYTKWGFKEVLQKMAASVIQPDISHVGGIMELKNIAAMSEVNYACIAPHCATGPITLAASLHLDSAIPNFLIQEHETLGEGYLTEPIKMDKGYVKVPEKPGLGIELDEDLIKEKIYDGDFSNPSILREDGSLGEW